jgi:hypothetical protein
MAAAPQTKPWPPRARRKTANCDWTHPVKPQSAQAGRHHDGHDRHRSGQDLVLNPSTVNFPLRRAASVSTLDCEALAQLGASPRGTGSATMPARVGVARRPVRSRGHPRRSRDGPASGRSEQQSRRHVAGQVVARRDAGARRGTARTHSLGIHAPAETRAWPSQRPRLNTSFRATRRGAFAARPSMR